MLHLASRTGPAFVARVRPHRDALLVEQAHLERKAASAALKFMFTYPDLAAVQQPLSALAREELEHFEQALQLLRARGIAFGKQVPSAYGGRLRAVVRAREPERALDTMLVAAVIEARSCERMHLLAAAFADEDPPLAALYGALVGSEARHHALYVDLARVCFPAQDVLGRLQAIAEFEALALATAPKEPRLHGGD